MIIEKNNTDLIKFVYRNYSLSHFYFFVMIVSALGIDMGLSFGLYFLLYTSLTFFVMGIFTFLIIMFTSKEYKIREVVKEIKIIEQELKKEEIK
jgi:hypothetical protein